MNDPLDDKLRDAVAQVARAAPPPVPFDQLDRERLGGPVRPGSGSGRQRMWLAIAAGVIVVAGVGAVAWVGSRDTTTAPATIPNAPPEPTSADTVVTPTTAPVTTPGTMPATTPATEPVPTEPTEPATTAPTATPEPTVQGLFPTAGTESFTALAPSGAIDAALGDVVSLAVDGDLWLHPGAYDPPQYGRSPAEPIRLVDGEDPRVEHEEMGPNVVSWVGGFVNGALIYGDCCEPVAGNVYAVSEPEGRPVNLSYGWSATPDVSGRRWAIVNDYSLQLLDYDTGRSYYRDMNDRDMNEDGEYLNISEVIWSPDGRELWILGWSNAAGYHLIRYTADAALTEIDRHVLAESEGDFPTSWFSYVGRLPDGTTVLTRSVHTGEGSTSTLAFLAADGTLDERDAPWALPADALSVDLSPDGTTLLYTVDDTAYLAREGQEPIVWSDDIRAAWFVTTPAMPIGQPCPAPDGVDSPQLTDPPVFADLDGDGLSERITTRHDSPLVWYGTCGTPLAIPELQTTRGLTVNPVDVEGDGRSELWISDGGGCGRLYGLTDGELGAVSQEHCIGGTGGFACVDVDGAIRPVFYDIEYVGGNDVYSATSAAVTARLDDGTVLGTHTYQLPESEAAVSSLLDLHC